MAKIFQYGGWLVAIILVIVCAVLANKLQVAQESIAADAQTIGELSSQIDKLSQAPDSGALEAKVDELEAALADAKETIAVASMKAEAEVSAEKEDEAIADAPEMEKAEDESAEGQSQRERMVQAQLGMVVDMVYKDLFQELNLSPELTEQLRAAIAESLGKQQELVGNSMKAKDRTAKAVRADRDALRAALRERLADTLNADDLAAYDDYELVADQILMEKTVDSQLGALASGLTPENRLLTSQVMAEELVREFDLYDQSEETYSLDTFNAAQARALQATLDRLAGTFAEDQLGQVQGFVNQALAMFDAMSDGGGSQK